MMIEAMRYGTTEPLYPFGFGLSYGDLAIREASLIHKVTKQSDKLLNVTVMNQGKRDTEVIKYREIEREELENE